MTVTVKIRKYRTAMKPYNPFAVKIDLALMAENKNHTETQKGRISEGLSDVDSTTQVTQSNNFDGMAKIVLTRECTASSIQRVVAKTNFIK